MTFEQLQKARSDGSHSVYKKPNQEKKSGRANKNRYILACDLVKFVVWFCWFSSFLSSLCVEVVAYCWNCVQADGGELQEAGRKA